MFKASIILIKIHFDFISAIQVAIIVKDNLDYYKYLNFSFLFYKSDYTIVVGKKITKFLFTNYIYILFYQKYLNIFHDLIAIKEVVIACAYLIMLIIKFRFSEYNLLILYYEI